MKTIRYEYLIWLKRRNETFLDVTKYWSIGDKHEHVKENKPKIANKYCRNRHHKSDVWVKSLLKPTLTIRDMRFHSNDNHQKVHLVTSHIRK